MVNLKNMKKLSIGKKNLPIGKKNLPIGKKIKAQI